MGLSGGDWLMDQTSGLAANGWKGRECCPVKYVGAVFLRIFLKVFPV